MKYRLNANYSLLSAPRDKHLLVSDSRVVTYPHPEVPNLLKAIASGTPINYNDPLIDALLRGLLAEGILETSPAPPPFAARIRYHHRLPFPESEFLPLLNLLGFTPHSDFDFHLIFSSDYLPLNLPDDGKPVLLARPLGSLPCFGPWLAPGSSPCPQCLETTLSTRRWQQALAGLPLLQPALAATPASLLQTLSHFALFLNQPDALHTLQHNLVTFDPLTLHPLLPHSCCPPSNSSRSLSSLLSPLTGIVENLRTSPRPAFGFHHARAQACTPAPTTRQWLEPETVLASANSPEQALLLTCAEAAERYSCTYTGREAAHYQAQSTTGGPALDIPAGHLLLHYDFPNEPTYCQPHSNGCAAGPTHAAALESALLELIERDALALWWYRRLRRPPLQPEPTFIEAFAREGFALHCLDLTTDLGIPVCAAIAHRDGTLPTFATAAALTTSAAIHRATRELAQILYWSLDGNPFPELAAWWSHATLTSEPYLNPDPSAPPAPLAHPSSLTGHLLTLGFPSWSIDLTRSELGIPVARAFVPGLCSPWYPLTPGRLYSPGAASQLNPTECFL